MVSIQSIQAALGNTLEETRCKGLGDREQGKVRDSYRQKDRRIIVTSDRISAFDVVLGTIPFKGQVLNQVAAYWFEQTRDIVPNHILAVPDPNAMVVAECEQLPLEFIVRGYITGVTKTSAWYNYERGIRHFCGNLLPEGLVKDQKLAAPILTPTTKHEKHDRSISREEAIAEGLIDAATFDKAGEICLKLYRRGVELAATRGLILVDTKYELGRLNGDLVLSDEVHTPDSSRYWFSESYARCFAARQDQKKLDKEYVREWLVEQGFRGDGPPPVLSETVRIEAARRYLESYELLAGRPFEVSGEPIQERLQRNLAPYAIR